MVVGCVMACSNALQMSRRSCSTSTDGWHKGEAHICGRPLGDAPFPVPQTAQLRVGCSPGLRCMCCAWWFPTGHPFTFALVLPLAHCCGVLQCRPMLVRMPSSRLQLVLLSPPAGPEHHQASELSSSTFLSCSISQ